MFRKALTTILIFMITLVSFGHTKVIKVVYYPDGKVKMEMIKLNKGIVQINQYYPSGAIFESGYSKNSMMQGQWTRYDEQGKVIATAFYQNNVKIGSWNHYNRWDQSVSKVSYINGEAVTYRKYDENGSLIAFESRTW
jgi:antitoxin component YwqK of YwqJK toxin-antitoxin module